MSSFAPSDEDRIEDGPRERLDQSVDMPSDRRRRGALSASAADALRAHFEVVATERRIPVLVYGVVSEGELLVIGAVGSGVRGIEYGASTASRICSLTKSFVATAVMMLRDAGTLGLDDHVVQYVPEIESFRLPTTDSPPLTIRSLLTMSSGLPEDDPWADRLMPLDASGVSEIFSRGATFAYGPLTGYEYSNLGWVVLGRVVSNLTRQPAQRFIRDALLWHLGLERTTWSRPSEPTLNGHIVRGGDVQVDPSELADGDFAPMAGLWCSISDLCLWMNFFLDAFPARDGDDTLPLSRASRREMQQLHRVRPSEAGLAGDGAGPATVGYGFGLRVEHDTRFGHVVGHSGGLPGYGSHMVWAPDRNTGVAALANLTYASLGASTYGALTLLDDEGLIPTRQQPPSDAHLRVAAAGLLHMLVEWNASEEPELFAGNVLLDVTREERICEAAKLRARLGGTLRLGRVTAESPTRGVFDITGECQVAHVSLLLTPEVPPRIQRYSITVTEAAPAMS
jgi:CubicO group peptidase (beta-lactamase class C family)